VIAPSDDVLAIGSGGPYALSAARALMKHTKMNTAEIVRAGLQIAGEVCIYTNTQIEVVEL
jgi:ATP-dependent HslUV protease subunit HslV